jgi:hypothetical protein
MVHHLGGGSHVVVVRGQGEVLAFESRIASRNDRNDVASRVFKRLGHGEDPDPRALAGQARRQPS